MNWFEDFWFERHHANDLTDEFKSWWVEFYGDTEMLYSASVEERNEYWTRCAFAWIGWKERLAREKKKNHPPEEIKTLPSPETVQDSPNPLTFISIDGNKR